MVTTTRSMLKASLALGMAAALCVARPASAAAWSGVDGTSPEGRLCYSNGFFYGTTPSGGAYNEGTLYKIKSDGTQYSVIYEFTGTTDGANPCDLTSDSSGNIYLITQRGGTSNEGVLAEYNNSTSSLSVLGSFNYTVGAFPISILRDSSGNIFGGAYHGGDAASDGTVWEYSSTGTFTALHDLNSATDGANPDGGLLLDNGTLYGTACDGGAGYGSVYSITVPTVSNPTPVFTTMHLFQANGDGCFPYATLVKDNGVLYGTTARGIGTHYGGNIYTITETAPYTLTSVVSMGGSTVFPHASMILDSAGSGLFFGTTEGDDSTNSGSVYSFNPTTKAVTAFYDFPAPVGSLGGDPGPVAQVPGSNTLYFVTADGGPTNNGVLYSIAAAPGSTPFVLHNFNVITQESSVSQAADTIAINLNVTTARPNDLLIANMIGLSNTAFAGPSAITVGGNTYRWARLVSGPNSGSMWQDIWYVRLPVTVTSQPVSFTYKAGVANYSGLTLDVYSGTDPANPVSLPGFDAIGSQAHVLDPPTSPYVFNLASVTTAYQDSYVAEYAGIFWENLSTPMFTAGYPKSSTAFATVFSMEGTTLQVATFGQFSNAPTTTDNTLVTPTFTINDTAAFSPDDAVATALALRLPNSTP